MIVEFDVSGDTFSRADPFVLTDEAGEFSFAPFGLSPGPVSVRARLLVRTDELRYEPVGTWTSLVGFDYYPQAYNALQFEDFGDDTRLRSVNDSGDLDDQGPLSNDGITIDPTITGRITNHTELPRAHVEFDYVYDADGDGVVDGPLDGVPDGSVEVGEDGSFVFMPDVPEDTLYEITARSRAWDELRILEKTQVIGRHVFYNDSCWDWGGAAGDDGPIAPDKHPLLDDPGASGPATIANYTSFDKGINGIVIDVRELPEGFDPADWATHFELKMGNDADPERMLPNFASWVDLQQPPYPAPTVTLRHGKGAPVGPGPHAGPSDRITITWPDDTIKNAWLQVTMLANADTGLSQDDVFYFGNAVADTGNSLMDAHVNQDDVDAIDAIAIPVAAGIDYGNFLFNPEELTPGLVMLRARATETVAGGDVVIRGDWRPFTFTLLDPDIPEVISRGEGEVLDVNRARHQYDPRSGHELVERPHQNGGCPRRHILLQE